MESSDCYKHDAGEGEVATVQTSCRGRKTVVTATN